LDICEVEAGLDKLVGYFRDKNLNGLPEFEGLNPSIEHFARIFSRALLAAINSQMLAALSIKIWENEAAWAEYREDF
jgi:6-pyruvoyltetrahydropterin/6-carboxytetrahydropterin synthase